MFVFFFIACAIITYILSAKLQQSQADRVSSALIALLLGPLSIYLTVRKINKQKVQKNMTLEEKVKCFKDLGLLNSFSEKAASSTLKELSAVHEEEWGQGFDIEDPEVDLSILKCGCKNVWWEDTEADVIEGNDAYATTLKEWAEITNGIFKPDNITEEWQSEEGPVLLTFSLDKKQNKIQPEYLDDYLDVSILKKINKLINDSGYSFEIYEAFDQTAFIIFLNKEQKRALKNIGWKFQH